MRFIKNQFVAGFAAAVIFTGASPSALAACQHWEEKVDGACVQAAISPAAQLIVTQAVSMMFDDGAEASIRFLDQHFAAGDLDAPHDRLRALEVRAAALIELGEFKVAAADLAQGLALADAMETPPNTPEQRRRTMGLVGKTSVLAGDYQDAAEIYARMDAQSPIADDPDVQAFAGLAQLGVGDYQRAADLCGEAMQSEFDKGRAGNGGLAAACAYHAYHQIGDDAAKASIVKKLKKRVARRDDVTMFMAAAERSTPEFFDYFVNVAKAATALNVAAGRPVTISGDQFRKR